VTLASRDGHRRDARITPGSILIIDPAAEWFADRIASICPDLRLRWAHRFDDPEAQAALSDTRGLITMGVPMLGLELSREVVGRMPALEWVQCLLAGHEHVTAALVDRPDVVITTVRGIHGPQMAETVLLHMLLLARGVRRQLADQAARRWRPGAQPLLDGRAVGIVGLGASGERIARTCHGLGMTVYGITRRDAEVEVDGVDRLFARSDLLEVAGMVDFLVLALAAEPGTERLIDQTVLGAMRPTACLINVSRGSVVDEPALVAALTGGEIAGAGLDVFSVEPLPSDSPLWELDNVVITPHVAGRSDRYPEQTMAVVEPNLRAFASGDLLGLINVVSR
jgi:D-2-hydroxyacid dehydrogenase (NADP+)